MVKLFFQNLISILITGSLLFLSAGTLDWPQAWIFILECALSGWALSVWLYKYDRKLLAERTKLPFQKKQPRSDKIVISILLICFLAWYVIIGLDAKRFGVSNIPLVLQIIGFISVLFCMWLCFLVFKTNTFAATAVRIQTERKQRVISTGPYAIVRHPMYAAVIFYILGASLLLGSWYGLLWGVLLVVLFGIRTIFEEKTLKSELDGYKAYMKKVHYRFIPYLW